MNYKPSAIDSDIARSFLYTDFAKTAFNIINTANPQWNLQKDYNGHTMLFPSIYAISEHGYQRQISHSDRTLDDQVVRTLESLRKISDDNARVLEVTTTNGKTATVTYDEQWDYFSVVSSQDLVEPVT